MAKSRRTLGSYAALCATLPLVPIRTDDELEVALARVEALLKRELDAGEKDYLEVLSVLVEAYEKRAHPIPDASEAEVLRFLMDRDALTQPALAQRVGVAQSTLSAVLSGKRHLTREQVVKFAAFFKVPPSVFLARG